MQAELWVDRDARACVTVSHNENMRRCAVCGTMLTWTSQNWSPLVATFGGTVPALRREELTCPRNARRGLG